jgi:hypothetical protein
MRTSGSAFSRGSRPPTTSFEKVTATERPAFPITDKAGQGVAIGFEAAWARDGIRADHLVQFSKHLKTTVPGIAAGLDAGLP